MLSLKPCLYLQNKPVIKGYFFSFSKTKKKDALITSFYFQYLSIEASFYFQIFVKLVKEVEDLEILMLSLKPCLYFQNMPVIKGYFSTFQRRRRKMLYLQIFTFQYLSIEASFYFQIFCQAS